MSRVVVVAPYPPMPGPEAAATLDLVRSLVAAGDDVSVVSPVPSAAHHHADPGGARGAARLVRLCAGSDRLVVRLDAGALSAGADAPRALPGRLVLAAALRRGRSVEVVLDRVPDRVSRRWAALVAASADRVVVDSAGERDALVAAGVPEATVVVEPIAGRPEPPRRRRARLPSPEGAPPLSTPADFEALLRRRAREERESAAGGAGSAGVSAASRPLRHLVRMERASVRSSKPAGRLLKRSLSKLLAWQFDNVIQHVNQLHHATIEALEALEERCAGTGRAGDRAAPAGADGGSRAAPGPRPVRGGFGHEGDV